MIFSTLICGYSCNSTTESEIEGSIESVQIQSAEINCDSLLVDDFKRFLNFKYGDTEQLLTAKLGQMSNGNFSDDSTIFIYNYTRAPRVPIQVWVNSKTNKVTTLFMEVLSLEENFEKDLANAVQEYNIKICDQSWFGKSATEIKEQLGTPSNDVVTKDFVNEISYFSVDGSIMIAFKVYPEQNDKCSSVAVTWFYD